MAKVLDTDREVSEFEFCHAIMLTGEKYETACHPIMGQIVSLLLFHTDCLGIK